MTCVGHDGGGDAIRESETTAPDTYRRRVQLYAIYTLSRHYNILYVAYYLRITCKTRAAGDLTPFLIICVCHLYIVVVVIIVIYCVRARGHQFSENLAKHRGFG